MAQRRGRQTAAEVATDTGNPDDIAELRRRLAESDARANDAEARAAAAESRTAEANQSRLSESERRLQAEETSCDTAIASQESELDALESQIATLADEPGNGKEIAKLQRKLADSAAGLREQKNRKQWLVGQRERAKQVRENGGEVDPNVQKLADGRPISMFTPKIQAWFRDHPEVFTDQAYLRKVNAAAEFASTIRGLKAGGDDYINAVEDILDGRDTSREDEYIDEPREGDDIATVDQPYSRPAPARSDQQQRRAAPRNSEGEELGHEVERPQHRAAGPGSLASVPASRQRPGDEGARGPRRPPNLSTEQREVADSLYGELQPADRYRKYDQNRRLLEARYPGRFN